MLCTLMYIVFLDNFFSHELSNIGLGNLLFNKDLFQDLTLILVQVFIPFMCYFV